MKKLILLFLPLFTVIANAEELKFVTVLSSPVGTFNKLEAVDSATPAKSPMINFCTSIGMGGIVTLKGTSKPEMKTVNLSQNTILGREDTGNYVLNQITMKSGGVLKGSRLLANTVQVNQATAGKSDKLYSDTLTVAGAKAGKLYVNGKDSYIESGASDPGMMWSNQYQSDKACGDKCKDQYLLKQQGGTTETPKGDCSDHSYKLAHKSECCPSVAQTDTDCWTPRAGVLKLSKVEVLPKKANCDRHDSEQYPFGPSHRTTCDGRSDLGTNSWLEHKTLGVPYPGDETSVSRCSSAEVTCFKILDCAKGHRENRLIGNFICETGYDKNGW